MSIRINRQRIAGIIQGFSQRSEEATYAGPRFIADDDVDVTLPLNTEQFDEQQFFQKSRSTGGSTLITRIDIQGDGPNDTLSGQVARITSVSATCTTISATSVGARRIEIVGNVIVPGVSVETVFTTIRRFEGDPGETLSFNQELASLKGLLVPPGTVFTLALTPQTATSFVNGDAYASSEVRRTLSLGWTVQDLPFLPIQ